MPKTKSKKGNSYWTSMSKDYNGGLSFNGKTPPKWATIAGKLNAMEIHGKVPKIAIGLVKAKKQLEHSKKDYLNFIIKFNEDKNNYYCRMERDGMLRVKNYNPGPFLYLEEYLNNCCGIMVKKDKNLKFTEELKY